MVPPVPIDAPLFMALPEPPPVTEVLAEPGFMVPLVLLLGDCWALVPPALMPESTLVFGAVVIEDPEEPGAMLWPAPAPPVPAAPAAEPLPMVCAKARPDAARLRHRLLATNKRDMMFLQIVYFTVRRYFLLPG
jgi:hypothetical protein